MIDKKEHYSVNVPYMAEKTMNECIKRSTYKNISVFKIISPVWSDFPLPTNVPYVQFKTLWLHTLDVKTLQQRKAKTPVLVSFRIIMLTELYLTAMLFTNSEVLCQMWHWSYWKQFAMMEKKELYLHMRISFSWWTQDCNTTATMMCFP